MASVRPNTTAATADRRFTLAEFARWSDRRRHELVDGRPVERVVGAAAAHVAATVYHLLTLAADRSGEAEVFAADLGYACYAHRLATVRRPSVTVVRPHRLSSVRGDPEFLPVPADLAVEVSAPATAAPRRRRAGAAAGAGPPAGRLSAIVWVVRLNDRSVTVHRPDGSAETFTPGQEVTAKPALAHFRADVGAFFA